MKRLIYLILFLTTFPQIQGCNEDSQPVRENLQPVQTILVTEHRSGKQWTFAGTAEDALTTDLSFRISGKIIAFPGDQIGRRFSRGEVIARLDATDPQLEVRQARARMEEVQALYDRSLADVKRIRRLFSQDVMARSELDRAEATFKSYEAQLNASSRQLALMHRHLDYTTLRAPFDGWIDNVKTNLHQNVTSGQAVVSFNAGTRMKMYVSLPDTLIAQIHEGEKVAVSFDAFSDRSFTGQVAEIGVAALQGSTYPVKIYLDNTDRAIRSGMSGHVNFIGQTRGNSKIFLPPAALAGSPDGTRSVWVVDPKTSTVTERTVSLGELTAAGIEILQGIQPGETIVVRGVHHLTEGLKVRYLTNGPEE